MDDRRDAPLESGREQARRGGPRRTWGGLWYKLCFFEDAARVPLIVRDPRESAGSRSEQVVSLVDLLPTMLDWAGAEPPAAEELDGRSLTPLLAGALPDASHTVLAENLTEAARAAGDDPARAAQVHPLPGGAGPAVRPGRRPTRAARPRG